MKKSFTLCLLILTFLLNVSNVFAQAKPELLYYKFDGVGATVPNLALSPPPGTNNATIVGSQTQGSVGQCGRALVGTGGNSGTDYVNTGWAPNIPVGTSWTISFWSSNIQPSGTLYYIFGDPNTGTMRCFTNGVAGANNWILRGAGMTDILVAGAAVVAPTLTTFVYDAGLNNVKAYRNGILVNTVAQGTPNLNGAGPFKVGAYATSTGLSPQGLMDEFRVYNRALTAAQVLELMYVHTTSTFSVSACSSYTVPSGDETYALSGVYNDTIANAIGCDSVMTITVTINNNSTSSFNANACKTYTVPSGDETYTASGVYMDTIANAKGCDSIMTINLSINNNSSAFNISVCNSYTVPSGDETYTMSGIYMDTIPNAKGCDSVMTINLTINNSASTFNANACSSYTVPSGNNTYTVSGIYTDIIPNAKGCDSVMTINLSINNTISSFNATACSSYTVPSGNNTYTMSGIYTDTIPNAVGCDSIMTINLTINNSISSFNISTCASYTVPSGNNTYTVSGIYMDTIPNALGCDSIMTISLTINNSANSFNVSACNSYTVPSGNNTYSVSGIYMDTIANALGCDSILTITLTINGPNVNVTQNSNILTSAAAGGATYQWINCNGNTPINGETNQSYTAVANGSYAVIVTQNNCTDTSACITVSTVGVNQIAYEKLVVYPNPTSGLISVKNPDAGTSNLSVTNVLGEVVLISDIPNGTSTVDLSSFENGLYFFTIKGAKAQQSIRVIKY